MIPSRFRRAAHRAVLVACALVMAAAAAPATVSQADSGSAMTVSGKGTSPASR